MWSPLTQTKEEGQRDGWTPEPPSLPERELGAKPSHLSPRDWLILGKVFEGKKPKVIAQEVDLAVGSVRQILGRPSFKAAVEMVEGAIAERIARGEFGVLAIAKANAVGAIRRIIGQSKQSPDERVRFNANVKLLELAGIRPPAPAVLESPERLIDLMTGEEAETFAQTGVFPARFADQLARLATSVLKDHEERRWRPRLSHDQAVPMDDPTRTVHEVPEDQMGEST